MSRDQALITSKDEERCAGEVEDAKEAGSQENDGGAESYGESLK